MAQTNPTQEAQPIYSEQQAKEIVDLVRNEGRARRHYAVFPLPKNISPADYQLITSLRDSLQKYHDVFPVELDFFNILSQTLEGRVDANCDDIAF